MSKIPYGNMIGHMLWPVMISHPDAVFATAILSQFVSNPGPTHVKALKHLISYLYIMRKCWLTFGGKDVKILTYTDANYAQQANHHLISGYCLIFRAGAISWSLKKKNIVTLSSTEAEYVRHTNAVKEILWIQIFGPKSTENQFSTRLCLGPTTKVQFNYPTIINSMHAQSTSTSATISFTRHSKINSWKSNMFPLTKILRTYSPNRFPGRFSRSLGKC